MRLLFLLLLVLLVCVNETAAGVPGYRKRKRFMECAKMGGECKYQRTRGCSILPAECKSRYKHCCRV